MLAEKDGKKTGSTRISLSCMIPVVIYTPVYMIRVKYLTSRRLRSGRLWCTVNYAICCNSWCSYIGCEHWRPAPPSNIGSDVQLDHNSTRTSCPFLEYLRIAQRMHTPQHLQGQSLQVELSWVEVWAPRDTFTSLPGSDLIWKRPVLVDTIFVIFKCFLGHVDLVECCLMLISWSESVATYLQ